MKLLDFLIVEQLNEHLGNLTKLDRKFLYALKTETDSTRRKHVGNITLDNADKFPLSIGANSELVQISYKSGADFLEMLKNPNKKDDKGNRSWPNASDIYVLVNPVTNEQCFVIVKMDWKHFRIGIDAQAFTEEQYNELLPLFENGNVIGFYNKGSNGGISFSSFVDLSVVSKAIAALNKVIFKKNKPIIYSIQPDPVRATKRTIRVKSQQGVIKTPVTPKEKETFRKNARLELAKRLDMYKSQKSKGVEDVSQLHDLFTEHGPLEKLKIGKYHYKLTGNDYVNFKSLIKGDAYIEYEVNSSFPEVKEMKKKFYTEMSNRKYSRNTEAELMAYFKLPPPAFRVFLKFEGNMIKPVKIDFNTSSSANWYY
ncbi:MAG: hypothetical protein QXN55_01200 [Candidatus Nitrosotenuis sp.]